MPPRRPDSNKHAGLHTTGDCPTPIRARVEQALRELPLTDEQIGYAIHQFNANLVLRHNKQLRPDSPFFDFRGKIIAVAEHFHDQGLTLELYLSIAMRRPSLFTQAAATIIGNVETVPRHFHCAGLTVADYLHAALKQPSLFSMSPASVIRKIEAVAGRFRDQGLTLPEYLRAARRQPSLFTKTSATVIANIERVVAHFAPLGVTMPEYVSAALRTPSLFSQASATIIRNVESMAGYFGDHGLASPRYLRAAIKQPSLFTHAPATIIRNVETVAVHFRDQGLTLPGYLNAALRRPSLLSMKPATVIRNVEQVAAHFLPHGLTLADYLRAALKQPQLFYQRPATLVANIEAVAHHFREAGLTLPDYLRAAVRGPALFYCAPAAVIANIEEVVDHFREDGVTLAAYLRAAVRQPSLFYQSPATIQSNIEAVVDRFREDGLTLPAYLGAAVYQPQLFQQRPATIIGHVKLVMEMERAGFVRFPANNRRMSGARHDNMFAFLVRCPRFFCLSGDNYGLRIRYAQVSGERPVGTALLTRPRPRIEQDLAAAQSQKPPASPGRRARRSAATAANPRAGFSLVAMSILITVAGLVFVSMLPGREAGDINQKTINNVHKLEHVEEAMRSFMAFSGRRPCPADGQYAVNTANFGLEAATPGTCTGGTPAAPMGPDAGTGNIVAGTIPTKTLGLPDDYQFDEFGHRFTYVVDKRATANSSCVNLEGITSTNSTPTGTGGIVIKNATAGTTIDNTMVAYIAHGPSGYGAFPEQGSSVANRVNSGSTDGDMQTNAGVDAHFPGASAFTYSTANFTNVKVQKSKVAPTSSDTGFNDLVWYRPDIKNYCCLGSKCIASASPGFRINGSVTAAIGIGIHGGIRHGDINGDGHQDLVIAAPPEAGGGVYVIFGQAGGGYANPLSVASLTGASTGFHLYDSTDSSYANNHDNGQMLGKFVVGDINGDGYDDIIMCGTNSKCVIYYGHAMPFTNTVDINNTFTKCVDTYFVDGNSGQFGDALAIADVNGDGYKDIIVGDEALGSYGKVFVMFGRANTCPGAEYITNGLNITTLTNATTPKGTTINGVTPANFTFGEMVGVGDVNGDGFTDILIGDWKYSASSKNGRLYIVAGQTGTWPSSITVSGLAGIANATPACGAASATCGTLIYGISSNELGFGISTGDVTAHGNGTVDILSQDNGSSDGGASENYLIKGGASNFTAASYNLGPAGTAGTLLNLGKAYLYHSNSSLGVMLGGTGYEDSGGLMLGDINGDAAADMILPAAGNGTVPTAHGSVYVLFGGAGMITGSNVDIYASPPNGTNGVRIDCPYTDGNTCGFAVDAVDMNGDGITDLVIGVPQGNVTGSNKEGYVYVLYGKTTGWTSTYNLSTIY